MGGIIPRGTCRCRAFEVANAAEFPLRSWIRFRDVQNGPFNLLLNAGVEVELEHWLTALVVIHQDVVMDPVRYGPGIGIALTARLGS